MQIRTLMLLLCGTGFLSMVSVGAKPASAPHPETLESNR